MEDKKLSFCGLLEQWVDKTHCSNHTCDFFFDCQGEKYILKGDGK